MSDPRGFDPQRHALSHFLVVAISRLRPGAKFGCSFTTSVGFGCDVDLGEDRLTGSDLSRLETELRQVATDPTGLSYELIGLDQACELVASLNQDHWAEVMGLAQSDPSQLTTIESDWLGIYPKDPGSKTHVQRVDFAGNTIDFCGQSGPISIDEQVALKLDKLSGIYWRGDSSRPQFQRIEGIAFAGQDLLDQYLSEQDENRMHDHRQIGRDQDLFMGSELVGAGLPLWLPNGATIRRQLENFVIDEELAAGYQHVITPDITQIDLYKKSGHYDLYRDSMYAPIDIDGKQFMLRPMSCPHHFQIYKRRPHSYRELPVRLAEIAKLYRYEQSGELMGLTRLRSFTLADAHIICRPDQAQSEINGALDLIEKIATTFGLVKGRHYSYRLSLSDDGDSSKYFDDPEAWKQAEDNLRQVLQSRGDDFVEAGDEAAFYGPKIDVQMTNANGKEETAFTVQYDFLMPRRFELNYITADNSLAEVVVVHRSSIGCIERVLGFLLEHYGGRLPLWLSPHQLRLVLVGDGSEQKQWADQIADQARSFKIRVDIDDSDLSLGKKIHQAQSELVACLLVIGGKEVQSQVIIPQWRADLVDTDLPPSDQPMAPEQVLAILDSGIRHRWLKIKRLDD